MSQTLHETAIDISIGSNRGGNISNMSSISLTTGCLEKICKYEKVEKPVLQVIGIKPGNTPTGNQDEEGQSNTNTNQNQRYRLILSDGLYYQHATLTSQVNSLVTQGRLKKGSVIELIQYATNSVKSRVIIVIVNLNIIAEQSAKIGNPKNIEANPTINGDLNTNMSNSIVNSATMMNSTTSNSTLSKKQEEIKSSPFQLKEKNEMKNNEEEEDHVDNFQSKINEMDQNFQMKKESSTNSTKPNKYQQPQQQQQQQQRRPNTLVNQSKGSSINTSFSSSSKNDDDSSSFKSHRQPFIDRSSRIIPFSSKGITQKNSSLSNEEAIGLFPIEALNPYQHRFMIRARVISKGERKQWKSDRGSGELFSVDLVDESGEIRATAFNQAVDKFYDFLEVNKVYYISKAAIKPANKKFSSIKNDYEMQFDRNTEINLCEEENIKLPQVKYKFIRINEIENSEVNSSIDVIGIGIKIEELSKITTKNMREVNKRSIEIMDDSETSIKVTLWGNHCESIDESFENSIILLKNVKVGDFGGRSLSSSPSSILLINPDIEEAHKLKGWHKLMIESLNQSSISHFQPRSLTSISSSASSFNSIEKPRKLLSCIKSQKLGSNEEKPDFLSVKATIMSIPKDSTIAYPSCITERCGKKVTDRGNNLWFCEKCNKEFSECDYKYTLSLSLMDSSGQEWTRAFGGVGDVIMCVRASELVEWKREQQLYYEYVIQEALFRDYIFTIRAKTDIYEETPKLNITVTSAIPLDYASESKKLLKDLKTLI